MSEKKFYGGNPNLLKAGEVHNYEPWQIEELIKCEQDPIYFCEKYFKIVSVDAGVIPFKLHDYQRESIEKFMVNGKLIMNFSRQAGKTSVATVVILHTAIFNKNKLVALAANKLETSKEILERIKSAFEWLPDWLKGGVKAWSKTSIELENGSKVVATATTASSLRGKSVYLLYIDEAAFIDNYQEFAASTLPTLSSGKDTKLIISSTPKGLNHFYYYVKASREGKNEFQLVEVPWTRVPGRDEAWRLKALEELGFDERRFEAEYELAFQGSSGTLISGKKLQELNVAVPLRSNDDIFVYEDPVKGRDYVCVVDTSHGKKLDYSTFHIIDVTSKPMKQVAVFRSNDIISIDFAPVIYQTCQIYNNAYLLVELNELGQQVADLILHEYEYEYIIGSTRPVGKKIQAISGLVSNVDKGLRMTKATKPFGCAMLKMIIENDQLIIIDSETINELNTFSKDKFSYSAEKGKHDDLVMPLVLFGWLFDQEYFKELVGEKLQNRLKERDDDVYGFLTPIISNYDEEDQFKPEDLFLLNSDLRPEMRMKRKDLLVSHLGLGDDENVDMTLKLYNELFNSVK